MATKQSSIQNINKNLEQFGQEEKIARAKLKTMPQSFNPEQGQALINATNAKVNQLENELAGVSSENIDQRIASLLRQQERGSLTSQQEKELDSLLTQSENARINTLQLQYQAGTLDATGEQELNDLLDQQELASGTDYGSLEPKLIKADKAYAQDLSLIRPILDVSDEAGKKLQKKLIEKHYGPLGLAAHQDSSTGEWTAQYSNKQQHTLPGGNPIEDLKRFGTSLAGGLLPNLIPGGGGKALGKVAGLAAARIAGAGGIEGFIKQRQEADAYNAAVEMGLLKPEEVKNISKKTTIPFVDMQIPESFTQGALAGVAGQGLGETIAAIPGAVKGIGEFAERVGTRGVAETAKKRAIQEAYLTEQLKNQATANPYNAATIIKNAIEKNVENYRLTANSYFSRAREASQRLRESGRSSGKDFADITDWWNEFTDTFKGDGKVVQEVADALGIVQTTPGRAGSTQVYSQPTRDPITGEFLISSLDFPSINSKKIFGDVNLDEGIVALSPDSPTANTAFTDILARAEPADIPTYTARASGYKKTTTIKPSNKDIITGEVQGTITPDKYLDGYEAISRLADEAQMTNPRLYNKLVEAKVAYQKPLIKTNAQNQLLAAEDVAEFAGKQTKAGFTTFKSTPKIPEGTAGVPFTQVKLGFQTLEEGYNKIPTSLRNKVSGPVEIVNQKLFTSSGTPTFKQTEAKQINEAIVNNYGNTSPRILQEVSDSIINQAIYRTKTTPTSTGIASSKITPELFEKASAITPQQQKALQSRGVSLNIDKKAVEAAPGELTERINLGGRTGILNKSAEEKDVLSNLVGQENYEFSQAPLKNLLATQEASLEPVTTMGKLKGMFQQAGQANLATDVGVGGLIGAGIGGITPGISGFQGAGVGGLAGAAFRPAARATGSFIQQIPEAISRTPVLRELPSFVESPVGQMLGKGITAGTTASFVNPEEEQNILQQILRTRKFTNGNY